MEPDERDLPEPVPAHLEPDEREPAPLAALPPEAALASQHVLGELLRQSHREAGANRAQARELVRAVSELRDAHEFLGTELRRERARSRWLLAALAFAPILAAGVVWAIWNRIDAVRERHDDALTALDTAQDAETIEVLEAAHAERRAALEERVTGAREALDSTRHELTAARDQASAGQDALERDRRSFAEREREWLSRIGQLERTGGEVAGLRVQLEALRDRSGAEAARADALERELRSLERAAAQPAATRAVDTPDAVSPTRTERPNVLPRADRSATQSVVRRPSAVRSKPELARISGGLNGLLALTPGDALHRITALEGVSGKDLLDVTLEVRSPEGALIRTIEAPRAHVLVNTRRSTVLLTFFDGHLARGELRAPFFQGRYALVLDTDTERWRLSGLTCVDVR